MNDVDERVSSHYGWPGLMDAIENEIRRHGIEPEDVDVAGIYDATTAMVLMALEDYGFCGRGAAVDFAAAGNLGPQGRLPTNTSGGMLSEGYLHGINNLLEVVRQMRGESPNQVAGARVGFYTVGNGSLLLGGS